MKKKGILRALSAVVVLGSALILTACGGKKSDSSSSSNLPKASYKVSKDTPAWKSDKSKTTNLTWFVKEEWWNKDYGKDYITKQIKKDLNVNIKFVTGDDTKLNTYFASGNMPDMITIDDPNSKVARTANTWAYSLQDLATKYDPYFYKVAQKDTLNWYKIKGQTYGYPNYSNTPADYKSGKILPRDAFIIRQDVKDAIGDQDFTTPEGFVKGMKAIKEKFPDLIPFGFNDFSGGNSSLENVVQDMLGVPITKNGKYYDRDLDSDYIKWLNAFREVHADGNISDDSFTDDSNAFKEKVANGKYATMMMGSDVNQGTDLQNFATKSPNAAYLAIDGIQSTVGRKPTLSQAGISGWLINYISNKSKHPAKAIQVYEYLLSNKGQMLTNFGEKGKMYTQAADGKVSWTPFAKKLQVEQPTKWQKDYRIGEFILFGHDRYKALNKDSYVKAVWQMQDWGKKYLKPQFVIENIAPDPGTQEARALSAIQTNWSTTMVSMIRAKDKAEFDSALAKYKKFQKENSIEAINKTRDANIVANKKKLNMK
ncbi:type 2 periplasmic-binding domain-containing protein [Lapidilactobacillus gannanensis]|uniref:Sugar ABC transporter substrate-binding protein n=1 Tax=Lapidilactobacillus gannanensis TaxID=2486002 RepID=A0ABW4BLQ3_9LACO|nr:sugar ABC transporter substrate-binding protein [Lapidilactobacillus gannanensis]